MNYLNKKRLSKELRELFDLTYRDPLPSRVIDAMVKVITDALRREEEVSIRGFGIFRVVEDKARKSTNNYIARGNIRAPVTISHPPKKRVRFFPAEALKAMMNVNTTYNERRARSTWETANGPVTCSE